ncbi:hypothetical protein HII31_12520 [Pseudocercospora fuligena]|uniref:F-box domain-containing protein n=1 Tax=Pseudocercospora fuligena TaxID=685502 RepID=A0A8H6R7Y6_9PEZI|nr:hypothetical protein HII31_12520 [Pseudocercospora fuligena]
MAAAQNGDQSPQDAAAKVFCIAELAEMILHGVDDAPTLVRARRVNKIFKEVIDRDMQLSKQKYWLACDAAASPVRWYEDKNCPSPYPQARPEEIELNPWAVKGCIPKLSLQYKDALFEDHQHLFLASVVMAVDAQIFDGEEEWWHEMQILRVKEQKRDLRLIVAIMDTNSPLTPHGLFKAMHTGDAFIMHLDELGEAQGTLKGLIKLVFSRRLIAKMYMKTLAETATDGEVP